MPHESHSFARDFQRDGFACSARVLGPGQVAGLGQQLEALPETEAVRRKDSIYGVRNLLDVCPAVGELATSPEIWPFAEAILGVNARAVRAIFFNKTADANWSLRWHQDSVIAVAETRDMPGFRAWACKAGVWQVRPPRRCLATCSPYAFTSPPVAPKTALCVCWQARIAMAGSKAQLQTGRRKSPKWSAQSRRAA